MAHPGIDGMFRPLDDAEEEEFRQSARDNYRGEDINPFWHPVYVDECQKISLALMKAEYEANLAIAQAQMQGVVDAAAKLDG